MGDISPGEPVGYTRDGTVCTASDLRELKAFLMQGGLIRVEGENQYSGQSAILRQYGPLRKQTTKIGVSLAATTHPKTQNNSFSLAVEQLHAVYIRRTAASHRSIPTVSVFTQIGFLPTTEENLQSNWCMTDVNAAEVDPNSDLEPKTTWIRRAIEYGKWIMGFTSRVVVAGGTGVLICTSVLVKKTVVLPLVLSTIIGWFFWNTSFVDAPLQTVKETLDDVKETTKAAAHTAKLVLQCIGGFLCSVLAFFSIRAVVAVIKRLNHWANIPAGDDGKKVITQPLRQIHVDQPVSEVPVQKDAAKTIPVCVHDGAETSGVPSESEMPLEETIEVEPVCMAHALLRAENDHTPLCMEICVSTTAILTRKMNCDFFTSTQTCAAVNGKADFIPLCLEHAEEYQQGVEVQKCRVQECWQKGALWHTDTGEVRECATHARDRLLLPMTSEHPKRSKKVACDSEMTLPPTPLGKQLRNDGSRSLSSPPKLAGRKKAYSFDDEEQVGEMERKNSDCSAAEKENEKYAPPVFGNKVSNDKESKPQKHGKADDQYALTSSGDDMAMLDFLRKNSRNKRKERRSSSESGSKRKAVQKKNEDVNHHPIALPIPQAKTNL